MKKTALALTLGLLTTSAFADGLKDSLAKIGVTDGYTVVPTEMTDVVRVTSKNGESMFFTKDGQFALEGSIYKFENGKFVNLAQKEAFARLEEFKDTMITFKAKDEKYVVTAFVDITCHYCHKLFEEMKEYNEKGITFRFLAFPREGFDSKTAMRMESIFTAENPAQAYTDAENGKMPTVLKEPNVVKKHFLYGNDFGVTGTPAIITPEGQLIPGYLNAEKLLAELEKQGK